MPLLLDYRLILFCRSSIPPKFLRAHQNEREVRSRELAFGDGMAAVTGTRGQSRDWAHWDTRKQAERVPGGTGRRQVLCGSSAEEEDATGMWRQLSRGELIMKKKLEKGKKPDPHFDACLPERQH